MVRYKQVEGGVFVPNRMCRFIVVSTGCMVAPSNQGRQTVKKILDGAGWSPDKRSIHCQRFAHPATYHPRRVSNADAIHMRRASNNGHILDLWFTCKLFPLVRRAQLSRRKAGMESHFINGRLLNVLIVWQGDATSRPSKYMHLQQPIYLLNGWD